MSSVAAGAEGSAFPLENLPYGVFVEPASAQARIGVAIGDLVLDAAGAARSAGFADADVEKLAAPVLNPLMAAGPAAWQRVRQHLGELLADDGKAGLVAAHLHRQSAVEMLLPFEVADYADFYSSEQHAENVGRIFRPGSDPLSANWKHLPIGYHGRAGTVVVSGTPVRRPWGQAMPAGGRSPRFAPSERLDVEVEVGFVVGVGSRLGEPVAAGSFADHVFGICLLNDWSARDIQAFESVPLGPFLGKSFATSISPWIVPLAALQAARCEPPARDVAPYLADGEPWGLDLHLELECNGSVVSRPPFAGMYWTGAQQLAHLTVNGASLRTGDLFGSGTVSGPSPSERGSFLELSWNGAEPVRLADGTRRSFLEDGDVVIMRGTAPGTAGRQIGLGELAGKVLPALERA